MPAEQVFKRMPVEWFPDLEQEEALSRQGPDGTKAAREASSDGKKRGCRSKF